MKRVLLFFVLFFHGCAASIVGYLGVREAAVFDYGPEGDRAFRKRVLDESVFTGLSNYSTERLLINCLFGLRSFTQLMATSESRNAYAAECKMFSEQIRVNAPLNSLSWIVSAMTSKQLGDYGGMNVGLINSQRTAPNEQWLAISRYEIAADNTGKLTPEAHSTYQADLALLAQSRLGVRAIAGRYVSNPEFREQITDIVSSLPSDTQNRFLNSIRAVMNSQN